MSTIGSSPVFVYITASNKAEALQIGRALVEERLAACVNVIDQMSSIYWWQGKIEEAGEAVLIAKTVDVLAERLMARVCSLHSYECPCVVCLPIVAGNDRYLQWIAAETNTE